MHAQPQIIASFRQSLHPECFSGRCGFETFGSSQPAATGQEKAWPSPEVALLRHDQHDGGLGVPGLSLQKRQHPLERIPRDLIGTLVSHEAVRHLQTVLG